ncbi:MAG: DNA-protecting protein DprA [Anaerolineae bacterium]|nr:DNA-protecting protein DprA [Anaerolineae bacterium]
MDLSADAQAMVLLCSHLGMGGSLELKALTLREWNDLATRVHHSTLQRPAALFGLVVDDLRKELDIPEALAERVVRLLERGGMLAIELERQSSLGMWVLTRADDAYPARWRQRLQGAAPAVVFGSGERALLGQPGVAVVGSRNVDQQGEVCAELVGSACALTGYVLYSGGARGVDSTATTAALEGRGTAVGVLAHSLERAIRSPEARDALARGDLALATPYSPDAGFSVGAAMGRNKLIYALADYAIVVACDAGRGGTWAGATEALKARWIPVLVLDGPDVPEGNRWLVKRGGIPFSIDSLIEADSVREWLAVKAEAFAPPPTQPRLL